MSGSPDVRVVEISSVVPNSWNPNEMKDSVFNELAHDVAEQGMDQPVIVIPDPDRTGGFIIVDGEHRWRAAKIAGKEEILVSVKEFDERAAKIATVRRNSLRGQLDPAKFTALVKSLEDKDSISELKKRMGISDIEFKKAYLGKTQDKAEQAKTLIANNDKGVAQTTFVANLSQLVREIVSEGKDLVPVGLACFAFKGKTIFMVSMDSSLKKAVQDFVGSVREDGLTQEQISKKLAEAFESIV